MISLLILSALFFLVESSFAVALFNKESKSVTFKVNRCGI